MEIVVQEGIEELVVIEELLEDPELTELEKCDALAPLYHVECIGLHIRSCGRKESPASLILLSPFHEILSCVQS